MKNAKRALVASLERYCARRGLSLKRLSHDWILQISDARGHHLVFGYDLGANASSAARVANDKSATYEVLKASGVPALEHRVFLHPRFLDFIETDGNWRGLLQAFEDFGQDVVVKDNEGTGGMEVFRARSLRELEQRVHGLMQIARGIAVSPYLRLSEEVRFVMIEDEPVLAYRKERPAVTGDGTGTVRALVAEALRLGTLPSMLAGIDNPDVAGTDVPGRGEVVPLQWRHNLGLGARPVAIDPHDAATAQSLALARQATKALGLVFASVDVVTGSGGPMVMEVNSGVMLEVASRADESSEAFADRIYHRILDRILGSPGKGC